MLKLPVPIRTQLPVTPVPPPMVQVVPAGAHAPAGPGVPEIPGVFATSAVCCAEIAVWVAATFGVGVFVGVCAKLGLALSRAIGPATRSANTSLAPCDRNLRRIGRIIKLICNEPPVLTSASRRVLWLSG